MTTIDPLLLNLLEAAERGEKCPSLVVVAGPWIIQGTLVGTAAFLETCQLNAHDQLMELWGSPERKNPMSPEDAAQIATQSLAPLGTAGGPGSPSLGLTKATLTGAVTVSVPAIRVPLTAITAWWVTDHQVKEPKLPAEPVSGRERGGGGGGLAIDISF